MVSTCGIVVGCDKCQEWLLPWWWGHYSRHASFPVAFVDMGMTQEGVLFCQEKGQVFKLQSIPYRLPKNKKMCEQRYGKSVWKVRSAWLKKPHALLQSPFSYSLWLDLDCQVLGNIEPMFHLLHLGFEMALVKDRQDISGRLNGETHYNSGVIAFRKNTLALHHWIDAICQFDLPGDQDYLNRALFLHSIEVGELPQMYNWPRRLGPNPNAIIHHYSGGKGKLEILDSIPVLSGINVPKLRARSNPTETPQHGGR